MKNRGGWWPKNQSTTTARVVRTRAARLRLWLAALLFAVKRATSSIASCARIRFCLLDHGPPPERGRCEGNDERAPDVRLNRGCLCCRGGEELACCCLHPWDERFFFLLFSLFFFLPCVYFFSENTFFFIPHSCRRMCAPPPPPGL